jgi:hypothetical protein
MVADTEAEAPAPPAGYFFSPRGSLYSVSPNSTPDSSPSGNAQANPMQSPRELELGAPHNPFAVPPAQPQPFEYYGVLDFECTCDADGPGGGGGMAHEIIEWPVVLVKAATNTVVAEFHAYIRPTERPVLSDFCRELTGITQKQVDAGQTLGGALTSFESWLAQHDLGPGRRHSLALVTDEIELSYL